MNLRLLVVPSLGILSCSPQTSKVHDLIVTPRLTCRPLRPPSSATTVDTGIHASYRKDFFHSYDLYPEAGIPDPKDGGRIQIAGVAARSGTVTRVAIDGRDAETLVAEGFLDWYHVWPREARAGEPLWVSFHSRNPVFDTRSAMPVSVETAQGSVLAGEFPIAVPKQPITYVTTTERYDTLLVHVRNDEREVRTLKRLLVNGRDVTATACISKFRLEPGESYLWSIPLVTPTRRGAAWTVTAQYDGAPTAVGVGRVIPAVFPIHTWAGTNDCPFPNTNEVNYREHLAKGLDTFFVHSFYEKCGRASGDDVVRALGRAGSWAMVNESIAPGHSLATGALARLLGDEVDGGSFSLRRPSEKPGKLARESERFWALEPDVATYIGGSRHRHTGVFAGVTDIQGMDVYVAACAPHITDFMSDLRARMVYDYTVSTRKNHAPLPTWIYTQGLHEGWNSRVPIIGEVNRQPRDYEIRFQAWSVIAGGAKGLMWFQTKLEEARATSENREAWETIGRVNRDVRGLRRFLREGEPTSDAHTDDEEVIAQSIRAREAIVVPVVNLKSDKSQGSISCALGANDHWWLEDVKTDVRIMLPHDFPVAEVFEVRDGQLLALERPPELQGRHIILKKVKLSQQRPARVFVLAADAGVRSTVERGMSE